jgi:very-short-patch-repair endonuclease
VARSAGVVGVILQRATNVTGPMKQSQRLNNPRQTMARRRGLRSSLTPAEAVLWQALQHSKLLGRKFRRQQGIGPYIIDFYCPAERLAIELDGASHDSERAAATDKARDRYLDLLGITVVRLENRHVLKNLDGVLAYVRQHFRTQ